MAPVHSGRAPAASRRQSTPLPAAPIRVCTLHSAQAYRILAGRDMLQDAATGLQRRVEGPGQWSVNKSVPIGHRP